MIDYWGGKASLCVRFAEFVQVADVVSVGEAGEESFLFREDRRFRRHRLGPLIW